MKSKKVARHYDASFFMPSNICYTKDGDIMIYFSYDESTLDLLLELLIDILLDTEIKEDTNDDEYSIPTL
jgi:predicted Zn-dependent peptidase